MLINKKLIILQNNTLRENFASKLKTISLGLLIVIEINTPVLCGGGNTMQAAGQLAEEIWDAGGHRRPTTWLKQGNHRTPSEWLKQGNHRTPLEWLMGVPSRNSQNAKK